MLYVIEKCLICFKLNLVYHGENIIFHILKSKTRTHISNIYIYGHCIYIYISIYTNAYEHIIYGNVAM